MSKPFVDVSQNGTLKNYDSCSSSVAELDDIDFSRIPRPRNLNIERKGSLDERSFSEAQMMGNSPPPPSRAEYYSRGSDHFDTVHSPAKWSGFTTPRSPFGAEPHPMIAEA